MASVVRSNENRKEKKEELTVIVGWNKDME
jgi:hypothetical protein